MTDTHNYTVFIEATSEEEAEDIALQMIQSGDVDISGQEPKVYDGEYDWANAELTGDAIGPDDDEEKDEDEDED